MGFGIAIQLSPRRHGSRPRLALGGILTVAEVGKGYVVGGNETCAAAHLYSEVGESQAPFHAHGAYGAAGILHGVARGAGGRQLRNDVESYVLGRHARSESSLDVDAHGLGLLLENALRGQHLSHLTRAYAKGDCSHGAMGRGVRIAADDGHSGQRQPLLGSYDMHYAVVLEAHVEECYACFCTVAAQGVYLGYRAGTHAALEGGSGIIAVWCGELAGSVVVGHGKGLLRPEYVDAFLAQGVEGLWRCHLMEVETVDVELGGAVIDALDDMGIPYLVEKGAGRLHGFTVHVCGCG